MLVISPHTPIFLCSIPVDMRKGFDGLGGIVRSSLQADPLDGSLFLFVNRRRDRLKILQWDGAGFWLHYRLLEAGTFETIASNEPSVRLDAAQLAMLLSGVPLDTRRRKRFRLPA